uniref:Ig-like domain-containing protein n=1 Tax=Myripristis murdjan TaxID=586833 RepID=A0A667WQ11_9TELE
ADFQATKSVFSLSRDHINVKCETLTQPASLTVRPGQTLTITCQVSYSVTSYSTNWIRQPAGKAMEWIGYVVGSSTGYKDSLKNKFSMSTASSSNTVTLTGQNVQPEDTAVYYCARCSVLGTTTQLSNTHQYYFKQLHVLYLPSKLR